MSEAAAHFELANHLWRVGGATSPSSTSTSLPSPAAVDNWTYKRQAWSLVGHERNGGEYGRFVQGPLEGEEDDWPFGSDFRSDVAQLDDGEYYPKTKEVGAAPP